MSLFSSFRRSAKQQAPEPVIIRLPLPASGAELFTPPLTAGRVYKLTFCGRYLWRNGVYSKRQADAFYTSDEFGNLTMPYAAGGLYIDDVAVDSGEIAQPLDLNRATNTYRFLLEGAGRELSVRLHSPGRSADGITLCLEEMPPNTQSPKPQLLARRAQRLAAEGVAKAERQKQQQAAEAAAEAAKATAEKLRSAELARQAKKQEDARRLAERQEKLAQRRRMQERLQALKQQAATESNFLDAKFSAVYAERHRQQLLGDMGRQWRQQEQEIVSNPCLYAWLRKQAPEVLKWLQQRDAVIKLAERLEVMPPPAVAAVVKAVPITERTLCEVETLIQELFDLRRAYDEARKRQLQQPESAPAYLAYRESVSKQIELNFELLQRFGIKADTPEEAQEQFRSLWHCQPSKSVYEEVQERFAADDSTGLDIIAERVRDLLGEQAILIVQRKRAIRNKRWDEQRELESRIAGARQEFAKWCDFLRSKGYKLEVPAREREETLEEGIVRLTLEKNRVKQFHLQLGDTDGAEATEALYAEQIHQLFAIKDDQYT